MFRGRSEGEHPSGRRPLQPPRKEEDERLETSAMAVEARVEADHWWFRGRRRLVGRILRDLGVPPGARVLDVGSGTGTNLRLLSELGFSRVVGLDRSEASPRFCRDKRLGEVERGDLCALPFAEGSFDLVLATDVLEHVDAEDRALAEIRRVLCPGGLLLATVPAFRALWGLQDEVSHHRRRYRRGELLARIGACGLEAERCFHFNVLLFAPIWLARQLLRLLRVRVASENEINAPWLNAVLTRLFAFDVDWASRLRPPFGVSLLAVARRPSVS